MRFTATNNAWGMFGIEKELSSWNLLIYNSLNLKFLISYNWNFVI